MFETKKIVSNYSLYLFQDSGFKVLYWHDITPIAQVVIKSYNTFAFLALHCFSFCSPGTRIRPRPRQQRQRQLQPRTSQRGILPRVRLRAWRERQRPRERPPQSSPRQRPPLPIPPLNPLPTKMQRVGEEDFKCETRNREKVEKALEDQNYYRLA